MLNCAKLDAIVLACYWCLLKRADSHSLNHGSGYRGHYHTPVQYLLSHFSGYFDYCFPSTTHFLILQPSTEHHQGLNMYMRFKVPSFFFLTAVNKMHALLKETVWQGANYTKA